MIFSIIYPNLQGFLMILNNGRLPLAAEFSVQRPRNRFFRFHRQMGRTEGIHIFGINFLQDNRRQQLLKLRRILRPADKCSLKNTVVKPDLPSNDALKAAH